MPTKFSDSLRHLGVHISMDGNTKAEARVLFKWCQTFQTVYKRCPLTRQEAEVVYQTIFLPTITYPLPATTLPESILEQAQSKTTLIILSKMGYNKNMPKAVVYAPITHGRISLKHLHTKQGLQKVLQVLKHLRTCTATGKLIEITLQAYQIQAGLAVSILEDTRTLPWMNNRWITNLRQFLQSIQGTIHLENPWTIPKI